MFDPQSGTVLANIHEVEAFCKRLVATLPINRLDVDPTEAILPIN